MSHTRTAEKTTREQVVMVVMAYKLAQSVAVRKQPTGRGGVFAPQQTGVQHKQDSEELVQYSWEESKRKGGPKTPLDSLSPLL